VGGAGLFVVLVAIVVFLSSAATAFLPQKDQGVSSRGAAPVGATAAAHARAMQKSRELPAREGDRRPSRAVFSVLGLARGTGPETPASPSQVKDWGERTADSLHASAIAQRAMGAFSQIRDALVFAFTPPAVPELGRAGGFVFYLKDNAGRGHTALLNARNQLLGAASQDRRLANVRPNGQEDSPQLQLDIDTRKAGALGLATSDINTTLSVAWGGRYIDDFIDRVASARLFAGRRAVRMVPEDFRL